MRLHDIAIGWLERNHAVDIEQHHAWLDALNGALLGAAGFDVFEIAQLISGSEIDHLAIRRLFFIFIFLFFIFYFLFYHVKKSAGGNYIYLLLLKLIPHTMSPQQVPCTI